ncbi:phospholipase B1, membrane-associated [Pelobates cultripes]|uniref:Phospholipase B1, membrane-associated n=1 Tax=Pelobates cultripes TaxID=61616 RepID=A0AAD1VVQ3_PELCU|nr:phospholipase B1, membrane-associated [Pelobates cultripes]CAH2256090.1 phospholipase B1, membrane-associated [Pelobates cultripes]CAH2256094.1 phospholipase B1, membrane-associated [Pelobates cultripes]CAH2256098.1 phospholipase B1, membrane-associated [Pelobates cultripes]CAH2256102.1 phospholipase B1, membrane-associated [Pelobates cultripes]
MGSLFRYVICGLFLLSLQVVNGIPLNEANRSRGVDRTAKFLLPCGINNGPTKQESNSVHTLTPQEIRVISTLRSLRITSEAISKKPNWLQSLEGALSKASQFTESYVGLKLGSAVAKISPPPKPLLEDEAEALIESLKQNMVASFENNWKMVMVFVTAPDPCGFLNQREHTQESIATLTRVLDYLHQQLPKTIVSVVDLTELTGHYMSHPSHSEIRQECNSFEKVSDYAKAMFRFTFQDALERVVSSGRYDTRDDFTVVLHPVLKMAQTVKAEINFDKYGDIYEVECSVQDNYVINTYKNSPYTWLSSQLNPGEERNAQPWAIGSSFSCTDLSPSDSVPTSVHMLRPADFKVVAALGDSITAGNGAGSIAIDLLDVVTEYRGISWSIGGDEELENVTTVANVLRKFNPDIQGYSTGKGFYFLPNANLNRAVPGAKADDMLEQAGTFVNRMKSNSKINITEDWKLLTIFIGGNDLCGICKNPTGHSPENFVGHLENTLDYLHNEVPRLFVNLVTVLDILPLKQLYGNPETNCPEQMMSALCSCVVDNPEGSLELEILRTFNREYQEKTHKLVESGKYDTTEDFTVVIQPLLERLEIPIKENGVPDRSYMAPDCFHFGQKAHAQGARGLWKNMFEPVGQKTNGQKLDVEIPIFCPSPSDPYLKTLKNSNYTYPTTTPDLVHGSKLTCTDKAPSPSIPTSVHALRPADVTVVAAIGDSLTAGNGIGSSPKDVFDVFKMYRGLSWSIGGDSDLNNVTTLPNILLEFNPRLTGFATGLGSTSDHNSFLNQAVPGARAYDLPTQANALIKLMNEDKRVNLKNDWKVITLLIGANDLCASCEDSNVYSPVNFLSNIQEALDILHKEVPRAFVNLVEVMDIFPLREATMNPNVDCPTMVTKMLCPCLLNIPENSDEMATIKSINQAYQYSTQQLVDSGRYDTRDDFTVVLQPFFSNPKIPHLQNGLPDISYLAPDCFHLSQKSHGQLAKMLWKNMLEPVGQKTDTVDFTEVVPLSCPTTQQPFLRTYKNSNYVYPSPRPTEPPIQNWGSDMKCQVTGSSSQIPTSVHKLRPGDIKVIGALGDSLTAAFGAKATGLVNLATEWRGVSWSIGGDGTLETYTTLPNIFKKFNPNIKGFSTGTGRTNQMFNVAVSGAKAENMTSQARRLVDSMKESSEIHFSEDWKVITIFIGGNDLCQYCHNRNRYSLQNHVKHIKDTLEIFYREIPRVFVNLVEIMEVQGLRTVKAETIGCGILKPNACPCFINPKEGSPELNEIKKFNKDLQEQVAALAEKFQDREDFAVVAQPFLKNTAVPVDSTGEPDASYFSADCFHFQERGHAEMAIALWNNMLEPVGQKQNFNNFTHDRSKLKCPKDVHHYLYTLKNSGLPENVIPELPKEESNDQVPYWSVIVASIGGVALGCAVVGIAMHVSAKKRKRKQSTF